jgi:hypothetical protein
MEETNLNLEELKIILESLIFSANADICAEWYKEDQEKILNLAKKIKNLHPNIKLQNVYIDKNIIQANDQQFLEPTTYEISNMFPEILKEVNL